ncbi:hypothetical protein CC1G_08370 [Coprinopsis cinerea okayama7|uniref:Uncharacterized protein n=1 Tax=Coprinopsis cinerea (strain Okayama-7 / 130 / ATCC MYA-4618 / FGSC 9003) TaxID=240176 RepID=A8NAB4_COPC7|nr:hypothetical protein CC1G_08370 [Coprinopsis cinerea okayama7\|eukprot:XP_001831766.2 hypothetical protein CC1G_08370 [Coprinopsis cinerea okayama7\
MGQGVSFQGRDAPELRPLLLTDHRAANSGSGGEQSLRAQCRHTTSDVARVEDGDGAVANCPTVESNPAVLISGGACVTGTPVIVGGNVTNANIYNGPVHFTMGGSKDERLNELSGEIRDWLAPNVNFHAIQQLNYEKWTDGTLSWFTESEDYLTWKDGTHRILWGTGIPGAGKTILAIPQEALCCFCVLPIFRTIERQGYPRIPLVKQFLETDPSLVDLIEPLYSLQKERKTRPTQEELVDLLRQFESRFDAVFSVIDGLDEALVDTQFDLIKAIGTLRGRFALTSRPLKRLESGLPTTRFYSVTANNSDIILLILQKVERNPGFRSLLEQHSYLGELVRRISDKSKGMFLHAALQVEVVQHCLSIAAMELALDSFPADLRDMYSQALQRICDQEKQNADLAKHVLLWLVFGLEALSFPDLQYALSLTLPDYPTGVDKEGLLSICCELVTVEAETDRVRLVHFTARDALASILDEHIPNPHGLLFKAAAQRLVDCGIVDNSAGVKTYSDLSNAFKHYPLLKYCYDHWGYHARECMANPVLRDAVFDFVRQCKAFPEDGLHFFPGLTFLSPLHNVARHGLHHILDEVLVKCAGGTVTLRTHGGRNLTPLMLASEHGHVGVIDALLRCTRSSMLRSTLSGECRPGRHLLSVQLNLRDRWGMSALMFASRKGHQDAVRRLLAHKDAQVNLTDSSGMTALMHAAASYSSEEDVVQLLLAHKDTQVNLADNQGWTALMLASHTGKEGIVRCLLAHKDSRADLTKQSWANGIDAA